MGGEIEEEELDVGRLGEGLRGATSDLDGETLLPLVLLPSSLPPKTSSAGLLEPPLEGYACGPLWS